MGNATLDRLSAERQSKEDFISELLAAAETESRDLVATELEAVELAGQRVSELDEQIRRIADFETRRANAIDLSRFTSGPPVAAPAVIREEQRTIGEIWTQSDEFRAYSGRGTSQTLRIPQYRAVGPDPLLTTTKPGSDLVRAPAKYYGPIRVPKNPLLDFVGRIEVGGATSIDWVMTSVASGADRVAEGAAKPPIVCSTTVVPLTLSPVAGWCKYSRNAVRTIPALRDLIDQKLRQAIDTKLAEEALAALATATATVTGAAGKPLAEVVRAAIADLEAHGVMPTAIIVNPNDHAAFDTQMLSKPLGVAQVQGGMWGYPIVPVAGVPSGTAYVGDISEAVIWFHNMGLEIYTTDSDISDGTGGAVTSDFRHNILTTLGEVFGVFGLVDQSAVRKVTFTP
jgi:HK97 family phage major capsid protein